MSEVARNPEARAVIGRRRRSLFMLGGAFVLAAVGVLAVLTLISPATFGRAMGLATEVPATITAVRLASEQPDNRDAQPRWDVSLAWTDPTDRTPRTGTATVNAAAGTYRPGQPDRVFEWLGDDFAFNDENPLGIWAGLTVAGALVLLALVNLRAAAPWNQLLRSLETAGEPLRVRVTAFAPASGRQWRPLVDYTPIASGEPGAVFRLYPQPPFVYPRAGDELELWALHRNRRGPILLRQAADGAWRCGLYRPHLQPVDP